MRINPTNFFTRQLNFLPPHFVNTIVNANDFEIQKIIKWIYGNCTGRYSITKDVIYHRNESKAVTVVGFENPGDLTLFALSGLAQNSQN